MNKSWADYTPAQQEVLLRLYLPRSCTLERFSFGASTACRRWVVRNAQTQQVILDSAHGSRVLEWMLKASGRRFIGDEPR